jgi:universal stress protein E
MESINKILVVNDSLDGLATALAKAAVLEHYSGAQVEVAEVVWDHVEDEPIADHTKANLIAAFVASERHSLHKLMEPYSERIAWSDERVIWNKHPDEAIAEEVQRNKIDLVIKPVGVHHGFADYLATPLDWKVLRSTECPVLISKTAAWETGGKVLAAVDVADKEHEALTQAVLSEAVAVSQLLDAQLHVVTAFPDLQPIEDYYQATTDYLEIKEELEQSRTDALKELVADLDKAPAALHVHGGKPAMVIKNLSQEIEPTVTVIGTSARHGLGKLVLGNTAEDVLNQLSGDILTVRT